MRWPERLHFDHRFGTYEGQTEAQANQSKLPEFDNAQHADPSAVVQPLYWVPEHEVKARLEGRWQHAWFLGFRDITNTTNERSVIASLIPQVGVGNKIPIMLAAKANLEDLAMLYANLCGFVYDYTARQKIGGTTLNFFIFKQLPVLPPGEYKHGCPWAERSRTVDWLLPRVLELTYTAWDLEPFARDMGYDGPPFRWDEARRFLLRCELDAAFFHLYGIARDDVAYVMDTFPIVRRKDEHAHGEYRTMRVILEIYDEMARAIAGGPPYQTRLDPPPADPRVAHPAWKTVG